MDGFKELKESEASEQNKFNIIFANDELIVVNKPYDVPMDGAGYKITVEEWATKYMEAHNIGIKCVNSNSSNNNSENATTNKTGKKQLKFVHQLDYSTSGVLCLAFSKDMAARLAHCFQMRTCQKYYLALLQGHVPVFETWEGNHVGNAHKRIRWKEFMHEQMMKSDNRGNYSEIILQEVEQNTLHELEGIWIVDSRSITRTIDRLNVHGIISYHEKDCLAQHEQNISNNGNFMNEEEGTSEPNATCNEEQLYFNELLTKRHNVLEINLPIGYDSTDTSGFRMAVQNAKGNIAHIDQHNYGSNDDTGKSSITYLHVLERCYMRNARSGKLSPVTKVLLEPHTGRRHQLRVHCHALGYPILGDVTYTRSEMAELSTNGQIAKNHSETTSCINEDKNNNEEEETNQQVHNADTLMDIKINHCNNIINTKSKEPCNTETNTLITTSTTTTTTTTMTSTSATLQKAEDWSRMYLHAWRLCVPCNVDTQWTEQDKRAQRRKRRRETLKLESAAGNAAELSTWTEFVANNSL